MLIGLYTVDTQHDVDITFTEAEAMLADLQAAKDQTEQEKKKMVYLVLYFCSNFGYIQS